MNGQAATMNDGTNSGEKPARVFTGRSMLLWLGCFFGVMFAANAVFVYFALTSWTGLEVDSSYKAGQQYQHEIDAAKVQTARGWDIGAQLERAGDGVAHLRINARDRNGAPLTGLPVIATLHRPTHRAEDRDVVLAEGEAGIYSGQVEALGAGQWDLVIEIDDKDGPAFRSRNRVFLSE